MSGRNSKPPSTSGASGNFVGKKDNKKQPVTSQASYSTPGQKTRPSDSRKSITKVQPENKKRYDDEDYKDDNGDTATALPGVRGLENVGNLCYLNSVLQCLSSIAPLRSYFIGKVWSEEGLKLTQVALHFGHIITRLWTKEDTRGIVDPKDLVNALSKVDGHFNDGKQHDPQELLIFLLDALSTDLRRVPEVSTVKQEATVTKKPNNQMKKEEEEEFDSETEWAKHFSVSDSIINDLFYGQLCAKTRCTNKACAHNYVRFDPFCMLSVPVLTQKANLQTSGTNESRSTLTLTVDRLAKRQVNFIFVPHKPYKTIGFQKTFNNDVMLSDILIPISKLILATPLHYFTIDSHASPTYYTERRFEHESILFYRYIAFVLFDQLFISDVIFHNSAHKKLCDVTDLRAPLIVYEFKLTVSEGDALLIIPLYIRVPNHHNGLPELLSKVPILLSLYSANPYITNNYLYDRVYDAVLRFFKDECRTELINRTLFKMVALHRDGLEIELGDKTVQLGELIDESSTHPPLLIYVDVSRQCLAYMRKEASQLKNISLDPLEYPTTDSDSLSNYHVETSGKLASSLSALNLADDCCTLDECFRLFFNFSADECDKEEEELDKNAQDFYCEKCNSYVFPKHETKLSRLPKVLIIHLKRFNAHSKKVETFVKYPLKLKVSDLKSYVMKDSQFVRDQLRKFKRKDQKLLDPDLYELTAVINHSGTLLVGHCTALCKSDLDNKWRYFSDTRYHSINDAEVVNQLAYVLIYVMNENEHSAS